MAGYAVVAGSSYRPNPNKPRKPGKGGGVVVSGPVYRPPVKPPTSKPKPQPKPRPQPRPPIGFPGVIVGSSSKPNPYKPKKSGAIAVVHNWFFGRK